MRRANTGWHDGDYDLPAGHLDGNESGTAATAREAAEELGIKVDPKKLLFRVLTHGIFSDKKEYYNIAFAAEEWQGEPRINEKDKCDAFDWFPLAQLPTNLTPSSRRIFEAITAGRPYVEYGFGEGTAQN
jgi:8-oxo-dGTP diphosphatase